MSRSMVNDFGNVSVICVLFSEQRNWNKIGNNWNFEANHEPLCIIPRLLLCVLCIGFAGG